MNVKPFINLFTWLLVLVGLVFILNDRLLFGLIIMATYIVTALFLEEMIQEVADEYNIEKAPYKWIFILWIVIALTFGPLIIAYSIVTTNFKQKQ